MVESEKEECRTLELVEEYYSVLFQMAHTVGSENSRDDSDLKGLVAKRLRFVSAISRSILDWQIVGRERASLRMSLAGPEW